MEQEINPSKCSLPYFGQFDQNCMVKEGNYASTTHLETKSVLINAPKFGQKEEKEVLSQSLMLKKRFSLTNFSDISFKEVPER